MLRDGHFTSDEYKADLEVLNKQYATIGNNGVSIDWYSKMMEIVDLTLCAKEILEKGTVQAKRNLLSKLGSNLTWNDEKLSIYNAIPVNKLVEGIKDAKAKNPEFEPKKYVVNKGLYEKTGLFCPVFSMLLRDQGSNLGHPH